MTGPTGNLGGQLVTISQAHSIILSLSDKKNYKIHGPLGGPF